VVTGTAVTINKIRNAKIFCMKLKTFLAVAGVVALGACSEPYKATDADTYVVVAPDGTQQTFITQYPNGTNAVWSYYSPNTVILNDWELLGWRTLDANDYVVRFDMDGENYYAWYDADGTWIGTAYVVNDYTKLPAQIHSSITTNYPGYTISTVNRNFQNDRKAYEVTLKNSENKVVLLMDNDGNILKYKTKPL
jgi:hypothetical protein